MLRKHLVHFIENAVSSLERQQMTRHLFTSYRPELHYMRGPGPKWREKHTTHACRGTR
jgi:hypothetical protein